MTSEEGRPDPGAADRAVGPPRRRTESPGTAETDEGSAQEPAAVRFTRAGIASGYVAGVPIALGVAGYGVVFGVLAERAGLSVAEAVLMSATVLAGAAQLIAVSMWPAAGPGAIVLTTLLVNLRYLLMGASLHPWFDDLSRRQAYLSAFFTADENWALTMSELTAGSRNGALLLGSGLAIWSFWVCSTFVGATVGETLGDPARVGLDFAFVAVFLGLAVSLWDGRSDALPWTSAVVTAVAASVTLPGRWYILLGGVAGCVVTVGRYDE